MVINWLEWLGYLASLIVLISLLMSSIIRLRWINLLGSSIFSLYGFLLGALPVGLMNLGIAFINIYYLIKLYRSKEDFKLLPVEENSPYFNYFINFYKKDIEKNFKASEFTIKDSDVSFFVLRNMIPAGVFKGSPYDEKTLKVELDFVTPEYRDFKIGNYIYEAKKGYFLDKGYSRFISLPSNENYNDYLRKMGFEERKEDGDPLFIKQIV